MASSTENLFYKIFNDNCYVYFGVLCDSLERGLDIKHLSVSPVLVPYWDMCRLRSTARSCSTQIPALASHRHAASRSVTLQAPCLDWISLRYDDGRFNRPRWPHFGQLGSAARAACCWWGEQVWPYNGIQITLGIFT